MGDSLSFIDPGGLELALDGTDLAQALWGVQGRYSPPFAYIEQALPMDHGAQVLAVRMPPSEVTVPFDVKAASEARLRTWIEQAQWAMNPLRGQGRLRSTRNDGSRIVRDFPCYLKTGLSIDDAVTNGFAANGPRSVLVFRGGPFWTDVNPTVATFDTASGGGFWFPMTFPWPLANSSIFAQTSVTNPGQLAAWPIITIRGPGSGFKITNSTTGEYLAITLTLGVGDVIHVDAVTPGRKQIYLESPYTDLMPVSTGAMFPFAPGTNQIAVEFAGATSATQISVSFNPLYFGP